MLLVAVVGAVLVSGCTAETPANDTLPTASEGAESSAELEPLGPADLPMPAEAREQTPAGAEAFIRYYVDLLNRAQRDLDTTYVTQFSADCDTCSALIVGLNAYAAEGYLISGGTIRVGAINPPTLNADGAEFVAPLMQDAVAVTDATGQTIADASAPDASFPGTGGFIRWSSDLSSWILTQLTLS